MVSIEENNIIVSRDGRNKSDLTNACFGEKRERERNLGNRTASRTVGDGVAMRAASPCLRAGNISIVVPFLRVMPCM